jgi:ribonuclease HI
MIKWIPGHVGLLGNENADELTKKGTKEEVMEYKLQWIDVKLNMEQQRRGMEYALSRKLGI